MGHYYPQFGQVASRPRSQGFTTTKRRMHLQIQTTRHDAKIVPQRFVDPSLKIPEEFQR